VDGRHKPGNPRRGRGSAPRKNRVMLPNYPGRAVPLNADAGVGRQSHVVWCPTREGGYIDLISLDIFKIFAEMSTDSRATSMWGTER
jgi:hypothetical protein